MAALPPCRKADPKRVRKLLFPSLDQGGAAAFSESQRAEVGRTPSGRQRRWLSGKGRRSVPLSQRRSNLGGIPHVSQEVEELWPPGLVGRDHFTVQYGLIGA
jgi:hypothetical protein